MAATSLLLSLTLVVGQIDAGPAPEKDAELLRMHIMPGRGMGQMAKPKAFPIARYLRLAEHLQSVPEKERVHWLRMAALSDELHEPAVLISLMLIVPKKGERFRAMRNWTDWGETIDQAGEEEPSLSPLRIYRGVPFFVGGGPGGGTGIPELAGPFVEYLLANGKWRKTRFKSLSSDEISQIAKDFLDALPVDADDRPGLGGVTRQEAVRRAILKQAAVSIEPTEDESNAMKKMRARDRSLFQP